MLLCISVILVLFLFACLVVVGTWTLHLSYATAICEQVGALGKGRSGQFSLDVLGTRRECEFPTADGLMLRGTYAHCRTFERLGVVVFCHEFGGDRHVAAPYMAELLDAGFDIFTFDFRNHGESECLEGYTPRTWATHYEVLDVQAAIAYLRSLEDSDPQGVALVGLSRGGSAALSAASRSDGIWALVTDGAFDSRWVVTSHIRRFMEHFVWLTPMLRPLPWFIHVIYGSLVHDRVARKLKHPCIHLVSDSRRIRLPLLMIHGARDRTIPVELAYRLRRKLPNRPRLWIVPKSRHNQALEREPARYRRRICRFLKNHAPGALRQFPSVAPGVIPRAASLSENTENAARERLPACSSTAAS
jgi:uncharacterized protein